MTFHPKYPNHVRICKVAKKRIPRFVYEYLEGGCFDNIGVFENREAYKKVKLMPNYLATYDSCDLTTNLFGQVYNAPFGIAPVGLQGLMWPNAPVILAKAAKKYNIPYILSTASSESIETISAVAENNAWFQLYNPSDEKIQNSILNRLKSCGYKNLVVTVDVPTFGFRPNDIFNGLTIPPKYSLQNFIDITKTPKWALLTLLHGIPKFKTLEPYMTKDKLDLTTMMKSMLMGKVDVDELKKIRDKWEGNLIIKGICSEADFSLLDSIGANGVIISNHGARQLDACESPITILKKLPNKPNIKIMVDSGIRSGTDIAISLASGASFSFLGRFFMYAVASLGNDGGNHAIELLEFQLTQVLEQIRCRKPSELPQFLVK